MTSEQFEIFGGIRRDFKEYVASLSERTPWLGAAQERLRLALGYDDYEIETPVVYNEALDEIGEEDEPRFIIVADNPGKNEQKAANRRYLVGQSGKLAQGWFKREIGLDFRAVALIVNKTPIHTPKTAEIAVLKRLAVEEPSGGIHRNPAGRTAQELRARRRPRGGPAGRAAELDALLEESQRFMAGLAFRLHACLGGILWVSGYGEMKPGGLFSAWADELTRLYASAAPAQREAVWVFRHFSMNQFAIEYKNFAGAGNDPMKRLAAIGTVNRKRILGW